MNEHLGLPGSNKTLRIDVFDKGFSSPELEQSFRNQTNRLQCIIIRTGCRSACRGVNRILDNDEDIFKNSLSITKTIAEAVLQR